MKYDLLRSFREMLTPRAYRRAAAGSPPVVDCRPLFISDAKPFQNPGRTALSLLPEQP